MTTNASTRGGPIGLRHIGKSAPDSAWNEVE
ncbi:unnamed protein product, partial [marine sediment metagenome]